MMSAKKQATEQKVSCPICGSTIAVGSLGRAGISLEELSKLCNYVKTGTLRDILAIAEITMRRMEPEKINVELQVKDSLLQAKDTFDKIMEQFRQEQKVFHEEMLGADEKERLTIIREYEEKQLALMKQFDEQINHKTEVLNKIEEERLKEISELNKSMRDIRDKVIGTGVGDIGEIVTILDLKRMVPSDKFSELRSSEHGTDIIATVRDRGEDCGCISISVKYQQKWNSEFLGQLSRNMKEDGARWGILVTKAFPREALSDKAWVTEDDAGNTVLLVKPEYAPLAYYGLRQASIHWHEVQQVLKTRQQQEYEMERIAKSLVYWIRGKEFDETTKHIDNALRHTEETERQLNQIQNYINTKFTKVGNLQKVTRQYLTNAKECLEDLRKLLKPSTISSKDNGKKLTVNPEKGISQDYKDYEQVKEDSGA